MWLSSDAILQYGHTMAFVTLAAAMVMPEGYGVRFPAISQLPNRMGDRIEELRNTAAGKFVLQLYQEYDRAG